MGGLGAMGESSRAWRGSAAGVGDGGMVGAVEESACRKDGLQWINKMENLGHTRKMSCKKV